MAWLAALLLRLLTVSAVLSLGSAGGGRLTCETLSSASNCSCLPYTYSPTDFSLQCPAQNPSVDITIKTDSFHKSDSFLMQCIPNMSSLMDPLSGLRVGDITNFMMWLCPLPDTSFKELMASVGINKVENLQIKTHNNVNDTLKKKHFENLSSVTSLSFNNNGFTILPPDLFEDMGNLTYLDMKYNSFDLPEEIFSFTPKLQVLELGKNNLTHLKPGIFKNLDRLRLLNLWSNQLVNLTRTVFSDVPNLESLDLNSNQIETIRPDLFADLRKLEYLNLHGNAFASLPQGLLSGNINLEGIQMQENKRPIVTLPPGLFSNLTELKTIKLSGSQIMSLPEDIFWGSNKINTIHLNQNKLNNLAEQIFRDLEALSLLDLSDNQITYLPEHLFSNAKALKTLKLNSNKLTDIHENLFREQSNLLFLDLRLNGIKEIKGHQFSYLTSLVTLDISDNELTTLAPDLQLSEFGNYSVLKNCRSLVDLQLANNSLFEVYGDWRLVLKNLSNINLSFNKFQALVIDDLEFIGDITVDFSNNNITSVSFWDAKRHAADVLDHNSHTRQKKFMFGNNPFNCDCLLLPFVQFVQGELSPEVQYRFDIKDSNLKCQTPKNLEDMKLKFLPYKLLTCDLRDFKSYRCPKHCSCEYRPIDEGNIVTCMDGLIYLPEHLSNFSKTNHTELQLVGNHLKKVQIPRNNGYENVTHFRLSNNAIFDIDMSGFSKNVELLDISHNNLTVLTANSISFLEEAPKLKSIAIHNNPWSCDCYAKPLVRFLKSNYKRLVNLHNVTCLNGKPFDKLEENEFCPETELRIFIIACVICAIFGLLMAFLTVLYYNYQQQIHIYCFSSKWKVLRWLVSRPDVDEGKKYDAFISYAYPDESFVTQDLVPQLERNGETKFKLCLHYRDWMPGESIQLQILKSIKESRRTIVVLSPHFLASDWGKMEFTAAYDEALKDGTARVVVILYKDVGPIEELDDRIKIHLQMNTYVKWGSPWFWQQLNYAMPHPQEDTDNIKCNLGCLPRLSRNNDPLETLQSIKTIDEEVQNMNKINGKLSDTKESPVVLTEQPTLIIDTTDKTTKVLPNETNQNGTIATGV